MKEIAQALKDAGTVSIPKEDLHDEIEVMAKDIFQCPRRNAAGRTYEKVFSDCSFIAIEHALARVIDGERNPEKFNFRNANSYKYDVMKDDKLYEVKRHKVGAKYFTYQGKSIQTFVKHCQDLDYLVTAYMDSTSTHYLIEFAMICDAKTFEFYFQPSNYKGYYYDHNTATRLGHCIQIHLRKPVY